MVGGNRRQTWQPSLTALILHRSKREHRALIELSSMAHTNNGSEAEPVEQSAIEVEQLHKGADAGRARWFMGISAPPDLRLSRGAGGIFGGEWPTVVTFSASVADHPSLTIIVTIKYIMFVCGRQPRRGRRR